MSAKTENRVAKYLDHEIEIGKDDSPEDVQASLSEIFPEVSHAQVTTDKQNNVCFVVVAGTKG